MGFFRFTTGQDMGGLDVPHPYAINGDFSTHAMETTWNINHIPIVVGL